MVEALPRVALQYLPHLEQSRLTHSSILARYITFPVWVLLGPITMIARTFSTSGRIAATALSTKVVTEIGG